MKFAAAVLALAACVQPAAAQESAAATQAATRAAEEWLVLADAGDYAGSWTRGADAFRHAVSQSQWIDAMGAVRAPLGAVQSRKLVAAQYTRQLPGTPAGEYVVIQYRTEFGAKVGSETIILMREAGTWKLSGYFIK